MSLAADGRLAPAEVEPAPRSEAGARILAFERIGGGEWDALLATFDGAVQEQVYAFAAARWPGVEIEPLVFLDAGQPVGGALIMLQTLPLRLSRIAVCKWGPVFMDSQRPDAEALYKAMIGTLIAEYADKRRMMLSVMPRASVSSENWQHLYLSGLAASHSQVLLFPDRYIVRLGLSDEAQKKSFAQKWRYHLNKAEKAGLSFEHAGPERLAEFDVLYHAMTDRKRFADHSAYDSISSLMDIGVPALRPELFIVKHSGEAVAGAIIFTAGDTAVYLYGATNERALGLRAGYFLHWHIIRWLRDNTRAQWYDLGGTDGYQGLHQFKKGMVGDAGVIHPVPPVSNYASHTWPRVVGVSAFRAREQIAALRRRIERMRGAKPDQQKPED